jgi:glycosidase
VLAHFKKLIAIRNANPALRVGTFRPFLVDNERELYAFERRADKNHCIIVLNRSAAAHTVKLPTRVRAEHLLHSGRHNGIELDVPPRQPAILKVLN